MSNHLPLKFCVRCEDPIPGYADRFHRAVLVAGRVLVSYFCAGCFKREMPAAYAELMR